MPRRPGEVGLYILVGILDSVILEHLALSERNNSLLAIRLVTYASASASLLAQHFDRANRFDADGLILLLAFVVNRLERLLDLNLVGVRRDLEGVFPNEEFLVLDPRIAIRKAYGLFRNVRSEDDIVWVLHLAQTSSILVSASLAITIF
jgi:hypothetical protein